MATEGARPKADESVPRFRVFHPEGSVFKAPKVSQAVRGEQESQMESTESAFGEPRPLAGQELTVFDMVTQPEHQHNEAQAKLERLRALNTARVRRYRERHRDEVREYNTAYKRAWRAAQRRGQGPAVK
jgi:hypothetical protein